MKVKFTDGSVRNCTLPTEQKIFKTVNKETISIGWVMGFSLLGEIASDDVDRLLTSDNIGTLVFLSDAGEELFMLSGYEKITAATIRHADNPSATGVEVQLSKGV